MLKLNYTVRCQTNPDRYVYDGWQTEIIRTCGSETLRCGKYVFFSSDVEEMKIFLYQEDNYKI